MLADQNNRDIFYKDPQLFVTQAAVDRQVDDIAFTLGVERSGLNVVRDTEKMSARNYHL